MKRVIHFAGICFIVFLLLVNLRAKAGVPQGMNYQAVARNALGVVVPNQLIGVRFTIHADSLNGGIAYRETHSITTTPLGIFTVVIGGGNIVAGNFNTLKWASSNYYLQVELDLLGLGSYVDMGTTKLVTVPYAFYANTAGAVALNQNTFHTVTGNDSINVETSGNIIVPSTVLPQNALVALSPGVYTGQILCVIGQATGSNGVRFENSSNVNVGASGGAVDITNGAVVTFIWSGNKWLKLAYSSNQ